MQELVQPNFATRHLALLRIHAVELAGTLASSEVARRDAASRLLQRRRERDDVTAAINATDVGPRLQAIERELEYAEDARKSAQQRRDRIAPAAELLSVSSALNDASSFASSRLNWSECERTENIIASEAEEARAARRHQQELALAERSEKLAELESVERNRVNNSPRFLGGSFEDFRSAGNCARCNAIRWRANGSENRVCRVDGCN